MLVLGVAMMAVMLIGMHGGFFGHKHDSKKEVPPQQQVMQMDDKDGHGDKTPADAPESKGKEVPPQQHMMQMDHKMMQMDHMPGHGDKTPAQASEGKGKEADEDKDKLPTADDGGKAEEDDHHH